MSEPVEQIEEGQEQMFVVLPRPPAKLAFEEWDGRVQAGTSRMLRDAPTCVICGANHTTCDN